MNIKEIEKHYSEFVISQSKALQAAADVASEDRQLAMALFLVSEKDCGILAKLNADLLIHSSIKNTRLFEIDMLRVPKDTADLEPIDRIQFISPLVKSAVTQYKDAQLQAMLSLKGLIDINPEISKGLVSVNDESILIIKKLTISQVVKVASSFSWCFRINYSQRADMLMETATNRTYPRVFVESTCSYW